MPSVFSVTSAQLTEWLTVFLWPFIRILALVGTAPIFGETWLSRRVKVIAATLLTLAIAPTLEAPPVVPPVSAAGLWLVMQQVLIGAAMGFTMRLVFAGVQTAGEYIGLQMGLSFASFFDPVNGGNTVVISRLLYMLTLLLFLSFDGHLLLIAALADSFWALPIAADPLAGGGWMTLALAGRHVFSSGLMLALPLVTVLLCLNLAMGILNRASPQFSIFAVGFPLTLLAGTGMLQLLITELPAQLEPRIAQGLSVLDQLLQALRP